MLSLLSPCRKKRRKVGRALPAPGDSLRFLVRLTPKDVGFFRFLLEAHDNLAYFTVLDPREALLVLVCSPHQEQGVLACLDAMEQSLDLSYSPWILPAGGPQTD